MLLEKVQKQIPSADQGLVDRVLSQLEKTEAQVLDAGQVGAFIKRCRELTGAIAPATPKPVPAGAIGGLGEGVKVSASAAQVRDRRNSATTTVLSNASNQVSEILEEAAAKAQQMLADKRTETVDRLAQQMAATAEGEIDSVMDFLGQFMAGTGTLAIADFQGLLTVEAEVVS